MCVCMSVCLWTEMDMYTKWGLKLIVTHNNQKHVLDVVPFSVSHGYMWLFTVQRDCVWLISKFTPRDRCCSWLGRLQCWWFPGDTAEELQSPPNSNNLVVWRQESWAARTHTNTHTRVHNPEGAGFRILCQQSSCLCLVLLTQSFVYLVTKLRLFA